MSRDTYHQLCFHIVWSTYRRHPILEENSERGRLIQEVAAAARRFGAQVLACNAMPDHVHLLVALPPGDLAQFIGRVKGGSSFAFNRQRHEDARLRWQDGYGIVSLRLGNAAEVVQYVNEQEVIHAERRSIDNLEPNDASGAP